MTMTERPDFICWDPHVLRAAAFVLIGLSGGILEPVDMQLLFRRARRAHSGAFILPADVGLGVGWELRDGATVSLILPEYRSRTAPDQGWTGPPQVGLSGNATSHEAASVLNTTARHLGANDPKDA